MKNKRFFLVFLSLASLLSYSAGAMNVPKFHLPSHDQFHKLPAQLKTTAVLHTVCDCKGLFGIEFWGGSLALGHAYEDYMLYSCGKLPQAHLAIENSFQRLNKNPSLEDRQNLTNVMKAAGDLGLNSIFLKIRNGSFVRTNGMESSALEIAETFRELEEMRRRFLLAKDAISLSLFPVYQIQENGQFYHHCALIALNFDGQKRIMNVVDHRNEKLAPGTPLFEFVSRLHDFFFSKSAETVVLEDVIFLLSEPGEGKDNFNSYKLDNIDNADRVNFLKSLFDIWQKKQSARCQTKEGITLAPLNEGIKRLKAFMKGDSLNVGEIILMNYQAMLRVIESGQDTPERKRELASKVASAVKKAAQEKFFDLEGAGGELLENAQRLGR